MKQRECSVRHTVSITPMYLDLRCNIVTDDRESDVALLLKCHVLQSRVLHKHNLQLARTSDAVAHAYAGLGMYVLYCFL